LKKQNKYDQMPPGLFNQLQRILPLADSVEEEMVCEETAILEKTIPRMFEVMQTVVKFLCDYVKRGRLGRH
jgi:hypothetical protein